MSRCAVAVAAAAACLAVALPAAEATPIYLELSGSLDVPVDVASLSTQPPEAPSQSGATATSCQPARYQADPANHRFLFREGADATGCLGVVLDVPLPAGARQLTARFVADRTVDATGGTIGPPTLQQEVRFLLGSQAAATVPYFRTQDGSQPPTAFSLGFAAPAGASDVRVEWWFANRGAPTSAADPAGRLQAWNATVRDPVIHLQDIPLPPPAAHPRGGHVREGSYLAGYTADVWVPAQHRAAAQEGRFSLALRLPDAVRVGGLLAPDGQRLAADRYSSTDADGERTLLLPPATLQQMGPGPYVLQAEAAEPLAVRPTMASLAAVALAAPPAALWLAIQRLRQSIPMQHLDTLADDDLEGP